MIAKTCSSHDGQKPSSTEKYSLSCGSQVRKGST
jgi:hypothetical protein